MYAMKNDLNEEDITPITGKCLSKHFKSMSNLIPSTKTGGIVKGTIT